ncbi:site-specific integrase [Mesorhizobium sp. BR1-1-16]|uniref:tyrosine-type recombinase/integrase n=1 Tax=Mesorhizobium sp. BR1-1-16 TaxID=2876653 RepID=UPI001CCC8EC4|nr:site-specific integrase [Mesorhizobium sp. BR1-1-16]
MISPGLRLGYRRGRGTNGRGGTWLAASREDSGKRVQTRLGRADDLAAADGAAVLTHEQAKDKARAWAKSLRAGSSASPALTVDMVLDRYFEARAAEGMKSLYDAKSRASTHIRPRLGPLRVSDLRVETIRKWRDGMTVAPKLVRTGKFAKKRNVREVDMADPEVARRRRDTANRTLTTLKAALNWARDNRLVDDDTAWRLVKPYRGTTAARVRFLAPDEQQRLIGVVQGDLGDLVAAALMTGARFSELARLTVRDFDAANGSIFIAESKSGKARHIPLPSEGRRLFERLVADKSASSPVLTRNNEAWKPAAYQRSFQSALKAAGLADITLHELRHSYASTMVRAGAPLMVVAQALGHTDTRMVEKHYAHLAPSYIADTIRSTAPNLALGDRPALQNSDC